MRSNKNGKLNELLEMRDRYTKPASTESEGTRYAVGIIRVSNKKQSGEAHYSEAEQEQTIVKYCTEKKHKLVRIFKIVESGSVHDSRKQFLGILEEIGADHRISEIVFSHQSRSGRNQKSARLLEDFVDKGKTLHFARDNRKLTNKFELGEYLSWVVENAKNASYIDELRKNVWSGMVGRMEDGLYPGKAPFGYKNFRPEVSARSIFVFKEDEAHYMRRAFELMLTGRFSVQQLSKELGREFLHLARRPSYNRLFHLLRNPFYYGEFEWSGIKCKGNPDFHPALISFDLWKAVQVVLNGGKRRKGSKKDFQYLGLIRCGGRILDDTGKETTQECNYGVTAEEKRKPMKDGSTKSHYYYHCSNTWRPCSQREKSFVTLSGRKRVNYTEQEIELLFEAVFRPMNFSDEAVQWMQSVLRQQHAEKSGDHKQQIAALSRRYEMLQSYINRAYEDKINGELTSVEWKEKHERWKAEREEIKEKINSLDSEKDGYIENGVLLIELAKRTESTYKSASPETKKRLVQIVSSNHVLRNGTIEFTYRKPFDLIVESGGSEVWWPLRESNSDAREGAGF